jgi:hypothetical protein
MRLFMDSTSHIGDVNFYKTARTKMTKMMQMRSEERKTRTNIRKSNTK